MVEYLESVFETGSRGSRRIFLSRTGFGAGNAGLLSVFAEGLPTKFFSLHLLRCEVNDRPLTASSV